MYPFLSTVLIIEESTVRLLCTFFLSVVLFRGYIRQRHVRLFTGVYPFLSTALSLKESTAPSVLRVLLLYPFLSFRFRGTRATRSRSLLPLFICSRGRLPTRKSWQRCVCVEYLFTSKFYYCIDVIFQYIACDLRVSSRLSWSDSSCLSWSGESIRNLDLLDVAG